MLSPVPTSKMLRCMWSCYTATTAEILCQNKQIWPDRSKHMPMELKWVQNPSMYSDYLRRVLIRWVINNKIDLRMLSITQRPTLSQTPAVTHPLTQNPPVTRPPTKPQTPGATSTSLISCKDTSQPIVSTWSDSDSDLSLNIWLTEKELPCPVVTALMLFFFNLCRAMDTIVAWANKHVSYLQLAKISEVRVNVL